MSSSLARRLRRVSILPSTFKEITEEVLTRDEDGTEHITHRTKRITQRHFAEISSEERAIRQNAVREAWRLRRTAQSKLERVVAQKMLAAATPKVGKV